MMMMMIQMMKKIVYIMMMMTMICVLMLKMIMMVVDMKMHISTYSKSEFRNDVSHQLPSSICIHLSLAHKYNLTFIIEEIIKHDDPRRLRNNINIVLSTNIVIRRDSVRNMTL